jgi:DNA repair exonuclease SbcCD ATPase subunit/DNA repair exonuclease SbcCD nuclease subunit
MKVAHLADIHIRNLKYHDNYRKVFDRLYASLREQSPDIIVVCGDLAHTKIQLSPEYVSLCSDFLKNLSYFQRTLVIPGNHDLVLSNTNRLDAISPIASNIEDPNLHYMRDAGIYEFGDFAFNHLSMAGQGTHIEPTEGKINIALYHGAIQGAKTDTGWIIEKGDTDLNIFAGFDFAMLGDIHLSNQIMDTDGKVRYPGSLIQQNFGEQEGKGYLMWDIKTDEDFTCEFIPLENDCPFVTVPFGTMGKIKSNSMVRVTLGEALTKKEVDDYLFYIRDEFQPKLLTTITKKNLTKTGDKLKVNSEDVLLESVQEKFLSDYVKDNVEDERLKGRIVELAKDYQQNVEVTPAINWTLKSVEWENLFSYRGNSKISFDKMPGIIGVFGENYTGKSSVVESILIGLFNSTSKSIAKSYDYINEEEKEATVIVELISGEDEIEIHRTFVKKQDSASSTVDFYINGEKYNGQSRTETDKIIQAYLGSKEDFINTTIATQFGSLEFVESKPTKRREIISRFFGLDVFNEKYKKVSNDYLERKAGVNLLKKKIDDSAEVTDIEEDIVTHKAALSDGEAQRGALETEITECSLKRSQIDSKLKEMPTDIGDIDILEEKEREYEDLLSNLQTSVRNQRFSDQNISDKITSFKKKIREFDLGHYSKLHSEYLALCDKHDEANKIKDEFDSKSEEIEVAENTIKNPPCHEKNLNCCKVIEAQSFLDSQGKLISNIAKVKTLCGVVKTKLEGYDEKEIVACLEQHSNCQLILRELVEEESNLDKKIKDIQFKIEKVLFRQAKNNEELIRSRKNKELLESKTKLTGEIGHLSRQIQNRERSVMEFDKQIASSNKIIGGLEEKIKTIEELRTEHQEKLFDFEALEYLRKAYHNKGIPLMIVKDKIHILNDKISELLTNIVDFSIYLEDNENIEIVILHPGQKPRKISLGSGAEKIFASIVIRIALMSVTNLSKAELFILDEPATGLDASHLESFMKILDIVKYNYENVILITHLFSLKDKVDYSLIVEKDNNVSRIL